MTTKRLPRLCYLEWVDSASYRGWTDVDLCKKLKPESTIRTAGWLIHETKDAVTISAHWAVDPDTSPHHSPMAIPKVAIKRRRWMDR